MRSRWLLSIALLVLVAGLLAGGCGGSDEKTETETQTSQTKTIKTEVGDHFSFGLDSNPSTGYVWQLSKPVDEKLVKMTASRYHGGGQPGQMGRQAFWFEAVGEGTTTIELEYKRPWESAPPSKTFTATVAIAGRDTGEVKQYSDPSVPIDVSVGQEFVIELEANPTTGYSWVIASPLEGKLVLEHTSYTPEEGPRLGAGGKEYWRFDGAAAGTVKLLFNYVRPWEKDAAPANTATFTVNVK